MAGPAGTGFALRGHVELPIAEVMPRTASRALVLAFGAVLLLAPPVAAERRTATADDPAVSTTSTTAPPAGGSTTSTTAPTGTPTTTTSTTSTTISPTDPGAGGDVTGGVIPDEDIVVPPPTDVTAGPHVPSVAIVGDLGSARARLAEAESHVADADARVTALTEELASVEAEIVTLTDEERQAVKRVEESRGVLADRAVDAYIRGNLGGLTATLAAEDPNEVGANEAMMESVLDADHRAVQDYRMARRDVAQRLVELADRRTELAAELVQAKHYDKAVRADVRDARVQLMAFEAGSEIFVTGMVFPVGDPHQFANTFLAPRSGGRQHQGVDIFAPAGTGLFAVERGVIAKVGSNALGGIKLWLYGESGTTYYYAHLLDFAPGIRDGLVVEAGDLVGYVGNTGNAATTPSHLHFEIHPANGPAVDPTPLLQVVDALDDVAAPSVARR